MHPARAKTASTKTHHTRTGTTKPARSPQHRVAFAAAWLLPNLAGTVAAQDAPPPAVLPTVSPAIRPAEPGSPLEEAGRAAPLLSEGTRLAGQRARLISVPTGEWIFAFDPTPDPDAGSQPDAGSDATSDTGSDTGANADEPAPRSSASRRTPRLPPMVAVPSRTLERLLQARDTPDDAFTINGTVLLYAKRNYLVPTGFRLLPPDEANASVAPAPASPPTSDTDPDTASPDEPLADTAVRDLIRDLENARREGGPTLGVDSLDPDATRSTATPGVVGEGTLLIRRRGRLMRLSDGAWQFSADGDQDTLPTYASLRLVPSSVLTDIERVARRLGPEFPLILTGRTLSFNGEAYLVPTSFTIERPGQVRPLQ
ncbi:MAG: hypothetical protein AAF108_07015 [Planctomycetota bacterium]